MLWCVHIGLKMTPYEVFKCNNLHARENRERETRETNDDQKEIVRKDIINYELTEKWI